MICYTRTCAHTHAKLCGASIEKLHRLKSRALLWNYMLEAGLKSLSFTSWIKYQPLTYEPLKAIYSLRYVKDR